MSKKPNTDKAMKALAAVDPDNSNLDLIREMAEILQLVLESEKVTWEIEQGAELALRKVKERGIISK